MPTVASDGRQIKLHPPVEPTVTHQLCSMIVELIDRFGNKVEKGGSRVDARALGPSAGACSIDDKQDGTYEVTFTANAVGDYKITVRLDNKDELVPLNLNFVDAKDAISKPPAVAELPQQATAAREPDERKESREQAIIILTHAADRPTSR